MSTPGPSDQRTSSSTGDGRRRGGAAAKVPSVQESALMGLRRRLAQEREALDASNTIVARIRRRNDAELDETIRKNAEARSHASTPQGEGRVMNTLLTQATPGSTASPSPASNTPQPSRLVPLAAHSSAATQRGPRRTFVDDARLEEIRRKPKNMSPAAPLHLAALLPPPTADKQGKVTLVLDIDETLVHASFNTSKPFNTRLTIDTGAERGYIYVAYRPKLKAFLEFVAPIFEVVIFTASMSVYAEQLMDTVDPQRKLGNLRLFREHCTELRQARVKDLALLGRPLERIAILDNSPVAYLFQPRNAIPITSWFDDREDREFDKLMPMLAELAQSASVYDILDVWNSMVHT